jgi:hypothetical protein
MWHGPVGLKTIANRINSQTSGLVDSLYSSCYRVITENFFDTIIIEVKDAEAIHDILWQATENDWFEYPLGSRLIFFRFPACYCTQAKRGVKVTFTCKGPSSKQQQPPLKLDEKKVLRKKIRKFVEQKYIAPPTGWIRSLIKYFAVPKGDDNVRIVSNATANRLNKCIWVPSFWPPTINTLVCALDKNSWMMDRDVGDMFLNYQFHSLAMPFTGVDLLLLYESKDEVGPRWAVWDRNLMGFAVSPYNSIKMALVAKEVC